MYSKCKIANSPIRESASHRSEMVSEILYNEQFEILESQSNYWHKVRCTHDDYIGWIFSRQLELTEELNFEIIARYTGEIQKDFADQHLPVKFGIGSPININAGPKFQSLTDIAQQYLGTPYLWGGRSISGIDCSGLTQMCMLIAGKTFFPRDAWQQELEGEIVSSFDLTCNGDLIFFAENEKITHVGMFHNGNIIHAAEQVRIDKIINNQIFNYDLQTTTLPIHSIKRYL
ncbi:MAG: SH3 domain-containing C40 family peptidase [Bacteroidota bacterium]|nr:SH3 domain-containing C40 family peptidase [Bacteroidota bacterium]